MPSIQRILEKNRIEYRTHGANCARGRINICCPWCNEVRFHLSISAEGAGYYCFRNSRHSGRNLNYLLRKLGIKEQVAYIGVESVYQQPTERSYAEFREFVSAEQSEEALSYIKSRGFSYPIEAVKQFNLKVALNGVWAGRLIIPLTVGWTGRSFRSHIEPRYLANTDDSGLFIHGFGSIATVQEGAVDGMRIAACVKDLTVIATCGQKIPASLIHYLRDKKFTSILYIPDSDVKQDQLNKNFETLTSYCGMFANVLKVAVPKPYKDPALLSDSQIRDWFFGGTIWRERSSLPCGPMFGKHGL